MRTTIDLPEDLLQRAALEASRRHTTLRELVMAGLNRVIGPPAELAAPQDALQRLQSGFRLGGQPLTRDELHERH